MSNNNIVTPGSRNADFIDSNMETMNIKVYTVIIDYLYYISMVTI